MATYTSNLNLKKPAGSENVAIGDINNNMDAIDTAYGTMNSKFTLKSSNLTKDETIWTAGSIYARRRGCVVELKIEGATIGTTSGYSQISTVPDWAKPYSQIYFKDDSNSKSYHVETDGKLMVSSSSSGQNWGRVIYLAAT